MTQIKAPSDHLTQAPCDDAYAATAAIVKGLAASSPLLSSSSVVDGWTTSSTDLDRRWHLPGPDTASKRLLQQEISSLAARIQLLERGAGSVNGHTFPDTPGEGEVDPSTTTPATRANSTDRERWATTQHGISKPTWSTMEPLEADRVRQMERELRKHIQTNEAFQKVLREIGYIITAAAKGDLSKKVQVHATELDPEIATFKGTINTMMDQLQIFASEVSRVAREVGTEGRLGGQAQITGVDGIWKELTENGRSSPEREREKERDHDSPPFFSPLPFFLVAPPPPPPPSPLRGL